MHDKLIYCKLRVITPCNGCAVYYLLEILGGLKNVSREKDFKTNVIFGRSQTSGGLVLESVGTGTTEIHRYL